jgi:hypothetical protein
MDSLKDILKRKADDIDIEAKRTDLQLAQAELERHFKGQVKVRKITPDGVLVAKLQSSAVASELRFAQVQIMEAINKSAQIKIKAIRSTVR